MTLHSCLPRLLLSGFLALLPAALSPARAQSPEATPSGAAKPAGGDGAQKSPDAANGAQGEVQDKRVFGVFPNYRTTDGNVPFQPITSKQKLIIGLKRLLRLARLPDRGCLRGPLPARKPKPVIRAGYEGLRTALWGPPSPTR